MRPELFSIFGVHFFAYRTMLAIAFVMGTLLSVRLAKQNDAKEMTPLIGLWVLAGALIGARGFYILQYQHAQRLFHALFIWEGGLVFYGGLIGGIFAAFLYLGQRHIPIWPSFDAMAPPLALGEAITRMGCFLNGCCYGSACRLPWAVHFPPGSVAYSDMVNTGAIRMDAAYTPPLHPTELYMTAGLLVVFVLLLLVFYSQPRHGSVFFAYLLLYGIVRFTVEVFRGDSARSVVGMTVSQAISLGLVIVGFIVLTIQSPRKANGRS